MKKKKKREVVELRFIMVKMIPRQAKVILKVYHTAMQTFQIISIFSESNAIVMLLILTVVTFRAIHFTQLPLHPLFPYHLESLSKG